MSRVNNKEKYKEYDHKYYIKNKRPKTKMGQAEAEIDQLKQQLEEKDKEIDYWKDKTRNKILNMKATDFMKMCLSCGLVLDITESQVPYIQTIDQLKQQLAEKDKEIAHLKEKDNYHLRYELAGADETITNLKQQLEEKDKEIEKLKQELEETNAGYDFTYEQSTETIKELKQNQTQLAIQELEKAKNFVDGRTYCADYINKRIQELKGE